MACAMHPLSKHETCKARIVIVKPYVVSGEQPVRFLRSGTGLAQLEFAFVGRVWCQ